MDIQLFLMQRMRCNAQVVVQIQLMGVELKRQS